MSRGIRNNNPGNIKDFGIEWKGLMDHRDKTQEHIKEKTFCVFSHPWWGIRAMAKIFTNYQTKHGLWSVRKIVNRWAPPTDDNPTTVYATFVATHMRVDIDAVINLAKYDTMSRLCQSIVRFENGQDPYTWEYACGLILAGIEPDV